MRRLFCIIWVRVITKWEGGEWDVIIEVGSKWCGCKTGMWAASRSWKGQGTDSPLKPPKEGMQFYGHLDFSLVRSVLDFWLPEP